MEVGFAKRCVHGSEANLLRQGRGLPPCALCKQDRDLRTPAMQEFYREGKEAEFFEGPEEFMDKVKFYLDNNAARMRIAAAGYARVIASGNDIHSRMRQWLADVADWRREKQLEN
jgi:hypothetical protein